MSDFVTKEAKETAFPVGDGVFEDAAHAAFEIATRAADDLVEMDVKHPGYVAHTAWTSIASYLIGLQGWRVEELIADLRRAASSWTAEAV